MVWYQWMPRRQLGSTLVNVLIMRSQHFVFSEKKQRARTLLHDVVLDNDTRTLNEKLTLLCLYRFLDLWKFTSAMQHHMHLLWCVRIHALFFLSSNSISADFDNTSSDVRHRQFQVWQAALCKMDKPIIEDGSFRIKITWEKCLNNALICLMLFLFEEAAASSAESCNGELTCSLMSMKLCDDPMVWWVTALASCNEDLQGSSFSWLWPRRLPFDFDPRNCGIKHDIDLWIHDLHILRA